MKFNFDVPLEGLDGTPVKGDDKKEIMLKDTCVNSLLANVPNEKFDGEEKLKRFLLAQRIEIAEKEIEITAEEITKIKECAGKAMGILVSGSIWFMLEKNKDGDTDKGDGAG